MPYTLVKFFLWGLLMAGIGGVIGWMLRSLRARIERVNRREVLVDRDELAALRGMNDELAAVIAERDRLRIEIYDVRGSSAGALGFRSATEPLFDSGERTRDGGDDEVSTSESFPPPIAEPAVPGVPLGPDALDASPPDARPDRGAGSGPDLDGAAAVLGTTVILDDLTTVEGIGPKIAELCAGMGISTWRQLGETDVATLQSMLDAGGSRFSVHSPESWPRQAQLLAAGDWAGFKALTDELARSSRK